MRLYRSGPRQLKSVEILLIERLLQNLANSVGLKSKLATIEVREMEDGGMGSLYFLHPTKKDNERRLGVESEEVAFRDVDGVPVSAVLNLDQDGDLFELDIFKADFSPTVEIKI